MSTTDSYGFYGDNWKEEKEEETESKLDGELNIDSSLEGSLEKSHEQPMMISERKRVLLLAISLMIIICIF